MYQASAKDDEKDGKDSDDKKDSGEDKDKAYITNQININQFEFKSNSTQIKTNSNQTNLKQFEFKLLGIR